MVGTNDISSICNKNLKHIDEQKKKIRKEKNAAKKMYKDLQRNIEPTEKEIADHNRHWRKLIRLHSKLKKREISVNERLERKANTKSFCNTKSF